MGKNMRDWELDIYRAIKAPIGTKLEEILKLLKVEEFCSYEIKTGRK